MHTVSQTWDTPDYYEPVRFRPVRRHHALSISLAIAVLTMGVSGALVYHRLDTLSDIGTYATMGPSQSHIEADHAGTEPTLLVTLTPPVYAAASSPDYAFAAVPVSANVTAADARAIAAAVSEADRADEARPAETIATDEVTATAAETPVAADSYAAPDPVAELLSTESPAEESSADSTM